MGAEIQAIRPGANVTILAGADRIPGVVQSINIKPDRTVIYQVTHWRDGEQRSAYLYDFEFDVDDEVDRVSMRLNW